MRTLRFLDLLSASLVLVVSATCCWGQSPPAQPRLVAHRGLLNQAPENTLANFRACLELKLGFEFDVRRSRDGHLVCVHDETVDRTTNGTGRVDSLTLSELQTLDAGLWFDPEFAGERVPTVAEILKLVSEYPSSNVLIAVDLKSDGVGAEVVRLAQQHRVLDRLLFIGTTISDPRVRREIKQASRDAKTAAVANTAEEFEPALTASDSDWVYARFRPEIRHVEKVHAARRRIFLAGKIFNDRDAGLWKELHQLGIDGVLTDYPFDARSAFRTSAAQ